MGQVLVVLGQCGCMVVKACLIVTVHGSGLSSIGAVCKGPWGGSGRILCVLCWQLGLWVDRKIQQLSTNTPVHLHRNKTEDISISFPEAHCLTRRDSLAVQRMVAGRLREIMLHVDLEEVSSKQIRQHLEEDMEMDLSEFRSFIDQTIMVILGQMEKPSMIKDYLYLVRNYLHRGFVLLECFVGEGGGGLTVYEGQYPKHPKFNSSAYLSV